MIRTMARKNYSDEFRRQAVDLYESTPDATLKGIAADLGGVPGNVGGLGEGVRDRFDGCATGTLLQRREVGRYRVRGGEDRPVGGGERPATGRQGQGRDRAGHPAGAAKYFAGETNW